MALRRMPSQGPMSPNIKSTGTFPTTGYPIASFEGVTDIRAPKVASVSGSVANVATNPARMVTIIVFVAAIGIVAYVLHQKGE